METEFWQAYRDQGLLVAALNPNGDDMTLLTSYVEDLHVTYPVGLESEETATYDALVANYRGRNPYPVDVIVDKRGIIRYVAREYDAPRMREVIEALLAEE